jgi:hypothetical protein
MGMLNRMLIAAATLVLCLGHEGASAQNVSAAQYPDFKGQWVRIGAGGQLDPDKPPGRGQQPPLTEEYRAIWEKNLADARNGSQYYNTTVRCMFAGMPRMMMAFEPMEIIALPDITYVHLSFNSEFRRIYTDGRDWPTDLEPTYAGYSIGRWLDEDGDGKYDVLEIETRGPFKGPRSYDAAGLPLHPDNNSIFKERIFVDKTDPSILHNVTTVIDSALTRPWTVDRRYRRSADPRPRWPEYICAESNLQVKVGQENYFLSADGFLMPARKDQPPPDLRYFKQTTKN